MLKIVTIIITIALISIPGMADDKKTLGFTTEKYDYEFNKFIKGLGYSWRLYSDVSEYEDIDGITEVATSCVNNETTCILITRNRQNHQIVSLMSFIGGSGTEMMSGIAAVLAAATPHLTAKKRGEIFMATSAKAIEGFSAGKKNTNEHAVYNGIKYTASASKLLGLVFNIYLPDDE